jgi:sporadic carbohydrate cluster protein (TIGR04323 family)
MKRRGWRGYIFSRPICGQTIPQRVQNLVVRTHAEKNGLFFLLSATEYHMPGSYMMLESLYPALSKLEGLLFYSLNMLPDDRAQRRKLYEAALSSGAGLRFALEDLSMSNEGDAALLEDLFAARRLSAQADFSLLSCD